ncbi:hypothetical protein JL_35 [Bacillus phage JL]|uniref:Uncharacterized protein n=1 Tax=Bacillus phage JL TaxID=1296655 RepID=S5MM31_9CAUD|nr:hypothetical protein AVV47_gp035 [Bacillus phage JL]AGR46725.1 hypothetical protein JL_35 [Bacillus phage JL]
MHTIQPPEHTLYINGMIIPIVIPGDMKIQVRNKTVYFQVYRLYFPKELMGVLTNHVWADGCLDVDMGYEPSPYAGEEPEKHFSRFEGRIAVNSYTKKWIDRDMLVLNNVSFTLHLY